MKLFCVALVIFSFVGESSGQGFRKAFVVPVGMDTIHGFVLDETDAVLARGIQFRKENDSPLKTYFPQDLTSFGFDNGRWFRSQPIAEGRDSSAIFVKQVMHGKLSVFLWRRLGKGDSDFFIENNYSGRKVHLTESAVPENGTTTQQNRVRNATVYQGYLSFVKGDSLHSYPPTKKIKYNERSILKDVAAYNELFRNEYAPSRYEEETRIQHAVAVGLPFSAANASGFRMSVFRSIEFPEKNRTVSYLRGFSYRNWKKKASFETAVQLPEHILSILPAGMDVHSADGDVRLFIAMSFGVLFSLDTDALSTTGSRITKLRFSPTGNIGGGLRIKAGSNFVSCEVTPSRSQVFINLGYLF